jgi:DNA polymerase-3 subunit delta
MTGSAAFLIVGDDQHLVSQELHGLLEGASPLSVDEFDSDADPAVIVQALETPALFGEARTVLVRGVDSMAAESQKILADYLGSPSFDNTLLMTAIRPVPRIAAAVKKAGRVIDAVRGRRSDLLNWLANQSKLRGVRLTGDALTVLIECVGESTGALAGALDELALAHAPGTRLGKKEVARQFQHRPEAKLFAFVDAVAERRGGQALDALGRLTARGEAPQMLIWNLNRHFRMMLDALGQSAASVARNLSIQPWRAEKLVRQARLFTPEALSSAYIVLAEADRKMKKSEEPEVLTLERTVVAICNR